MKLYFRAIVTILIALCATGILNTPALAGQRSATIKVSCTVLPVFEMAIPAAGMSQVQVNNLAIHTNLGNQYQLTNAWVGGPNSRTHLYSITAL